MTAPQPQIMLIGFSFSMQDDGAPGKYNEEIARLMADDHKALAANQVSAWIALQWEIADGLAKISPGIVPDDSHVAAPLDLKADDVLRPEAITQLLTRCPTRALEILWERLEKELVAKGYRPNPNLPLKDRREELLAQAGLIDSETKKSNFATYFNRILGDRLFYKRFHEREKGQRVRRVELHDLYRLPLGSIGVEKRRLPDPGRALGFYQSRRVNRLILQAILTDEKPLLEEMKYLSTQDGVNKYLSQLEKEHPGAQSQPPSHVIVYGHPEHRSRCRRQFLAAAFGGGWEFDPKQVCLGGESAKKRAPISVEGKKVTLASWAAPLWDSEAAQIWCRSKRNWQDYEARAAFVYTNSQAAIRSNFQHAPKARTARHNDAGR